MGHSLTIDSVFKPYAFISCPFMNELFATESVPNYSVKLLHSGKTLTGGKLCHLVQQSSIKEEEGRM